MPTSTNINGVWREMWSGHAMINGVWRDLDSWVNVNGVWRETFKHGIEESDIAEFRLVYKFMEVAKHPDYPNLSVNRNLPIIVKLTGDTLGSVDMNQKGIVFEYSNEDYPTEGIAVYRGDLYAVLTNNEIINVGLSISDAASDKRIPGNVPGINEAWATNKLSNLSITIEGYALYESYGYYMAGWNSIFSKEQFLDTTNYPDKGPHKNKLLLNSYDILPIEKRVDTFDSAAYIGIARDMTSESNNMIGSYGVLDHSISAITVNGVSKPFVVELYN